MAQYSQMQGDPTGHPMVTGQHFLPAPDVTNLGWMARCDSMDVQNDPRFFGGNILDRRLDALAGLGVVSGLLIGTSMDQAFGMKKDFNLFFHPQAKDYVKFVGFIFMSFVLYLNTIATYVSVCQIYHSYRLMTGGPTGFDHAKIYYLNPNIAFYRHIAVKGMLNSLWMFMASSGCRMWVKFSNDAVDGPGWDSISPSAPTDPPINQPSYDGITILAVVVSILYCLMGLSVYAIHSKHVGVFRHRYTVMEEMENPMRAHLAKVDRRNYGRTPDV